MPNAQSFIQQCVQQTPSEALITTCTTPPPVVTTISSVQAEKSLVVSGTAPPRTVSIQTLNPVACPGGTKTEVVTLDSLEPATLSAGTTIGTMLVQTPKSIMTWLQNTVKGVTIQLEKPFFSGALVTLTLQ